jgi:hypothetical protein
MTGPAQSPRVVFLHIGRTGGTTLGRILAHGLPRDSIFTVDSARREDSLRELGGLPDAARERLRLVRGHVWFGVHELLLPPVTYVTLVRDPVHRLLSHYHYVLTRPYHELHDEVTRRRLSFVDYARSGISPELDNWQTRVLAGETHVPIGECDAAMLERAKANVERWFAVAAPLERFDEAVVLCRRRLDWAVAAPFAPRNAAPGRRHRAELTPAELQAAVGTNLLDLELFSWACERFDATVRGEIDLDDDLRELQAANRRYGPIRRFEVRVTELLRDVVRGRRSAPQSS